MGNIVEGFNESHVFGRINVYNFWKGYVLVKQDRPIYIHDTKFLEAMLNYFDVNFFNTKALYETEIRSVYPNYILKKLSLVESEAPDIIDVFINKDHL
jgi:hypothetical protein